MFCNESCMSETQQQTNMFFFVNEPMSNSDARDTCKERYNATLASRLILDDYINLNNCCNTTQPSYPYKIGLNSNANKCEDETTTTLFWIAVDNGTRTCVTSVEPLLPEMAPNKTCHTLQLLFGSTTESVFNSTEWVRCNAESRFLCQKIVSAATTANASIFSSETLAGIIASCCVLLLLVLFLSFRRSKVYEDIKFRFNFCLFRWSHSLRKNSKKKPYQSNICRCRTNSQEPSQNNISQDSFGSDDYHLKSAIKGDSNPYEFGTDPVSDTYKNASTDDETNKVVDANPCFKSSDVERRPETSHEKEMSNVNPQDMTSDFKIVPAIIHRQNQADVNPVDINFDPKIGLAINDDQEISEANPNNLGSDIKTTQKQQIGDINPYHINSDFETKQENNAQVGDIDMESADVKSASTNNHNPDVSEENPYEVCHHFDTANTTSDIVQDPTSACDQQNDFEATNERPRDLMSFDASAAGDCEKECAKLDKTKHASIKVESKLNIDIPLTDVYAVVDKSSKNKQIKIEN